MIRKFALALALGTSGLVAPLPAFAQAKEAAPVDPERIKLAETMAGKIIPNGSYQKMMKDMADQMVNGMMSQMLGMDAGAIAAAAGDDAKSVEGKSLGDVASEADPHFKERTDIMMKVTFDEMGKLMTAMEPAARSGLAKVYARKYSVQELKDMNAFFTTPSGSTFAADFMSTFTDKELMQAMMGEMPKMLEAMPAIMKKVEEATAHLPPAPKPDDSAAMDTAIAEATAAVDAAAESPYANETGEEPWYNEDNWKPANQKKAAKLSKSYDAASEKSGAAYAAFEEAQMAAIDDARQRYLADGWKPEMVEAPMAAEDIPDNAVPPPVIPK